MDKKLNFIGRNKTGKDNTSSFFRLPSSFVKAHSAFTIVELLVVVAIIGVLLGIVTTVATSSMKNARGRRAEAMRSAFEQAIATFYAQEGKWPGPIETMADNASSSTNLLTAAQADQVFSEIVEKSVGANASRPLIDASALFVAKKSAVDGDGCFDKHGDKSAKDYCGNRRCVTGMDFTLAVSKGWSVSEMAFGWQGVEYGRFRRFWITYNAKTDSVTVATDK